jgi:hypothetical protein
VTSLGGRASSVAATLHHKLKMPPSFGRSDRRSQTERHREFPRTRPKGGKPARDPVGVGGRHLPSAQARTAAFVEREGRIELPHSVWKTDALPLSYSRARCLYAAVYEGMAKGGRFSALPGRTAAARWRPAAERVHLDSSRPDPLRFRHEIRCRPRRLFVAAPGRMH